MEKDHVSEDEDASSSSESHSGFSTGTSVSEDEAVSSASSQSDDAVRKPQFVEDVEDGNIRPHTEHTDYSVVRGEFIVDDDDDEEYEAPLPDPLLYSFEEVAPRSLSDIYPGHPGVGYDDRAPSSSQSNDDENDPPLVDISYHTPPRGCLHPSALEPNAVHISEMDDDEHEIVFELSEPTDLQALFESTVDNPDDPADSNIEGECQRDGEDGSNKAADQKGIQSQASNEMPDFTAKLLFGMFPVRAKKRRQRDYRVSLPSETDLLVVPAGSPPEVEERNRRRRLSQGWPPFTRQRQHPTRHNESDNLVSGNIVEMANLPQHLMSTAQAMTSPARTEPISDASDTPDRQSPSSFLGERKKSLKLGASTDPSETMLLSDSFPKGGPQQKNFTEQHDEKVNEDDDGASTLGITVSVQTLFVVGVAMMLLVILSTIGTSFLGAELALRGNTVVLDRMRSPEPNGTSAVILPDQNRTQPPIGEVSAPFLCARNELLFQFEIQFDSQPVEVGFSLRDSGTFGGASLWAFDAFSFRSFSQFLRKNIFSICLAQDPTYNFEVTDAFANGLVSQFGTSTLVYGQWSLLYNSSVLASYNGDCNATTEREDDTSILACGSYCACSFQFSSNSTTGRCSTNCTTR